MCCSGRAPAFTNPFFALALQDVPLLIEEHALFYPVRRFAAHDRSLHFGLRERGCHRGGGGGVTARAELAAASAARALRGAVERDSVHGAACRESAFVAV